MKKPNIIIGKKQIILAGMTLILGAAVYMNYTYTAAGGKIGTTEVVKSQTANYGDAELVSSDSSTADYFAQARINRMNSRDEATAKLKNIMSGGDSTDSEKDTAAENAAAMSGLMQKESKVESLVKAAGFKECVVYLDGKTANVVVKSGSKGLVASEAAQIKDILLGEVSVANENIKIYDVN